MGEGGGEGFQSLVPLLLNGNREALICEESRGGKISCALEPKKRKAKDRRGGKGDRERKRGGKGERGIEMGR